MKDNLGRIMDNRQQMFDIESKSSDIKDTASRFRSQSQRLEKMAKLKKLQMKIAFGMLFLVFVALIYFLFF
jgi:hypothetical protein